MSEFEKVQTVLGIGAIGISIVTAVCAWIFHRSIQRKERKSEVKTLLLDLSPATVEFKSAACHSVVTEVMADTHQKDFDNWVAKKDTVADVIQKAAEVANEASEVDHQAKRRLHDAGWKLRTLWRAVHLVFDKEGDALQDSIDVLFKTANDMLARKDWNLETFQNDMDNIERNVFPPVLTAIDKEAEKLWIKVK